MRYKISANKNLEISVDVKEQKDLQNDMQTAQDFHSNDYMYELFEPLISNSELNWVRPEEIGALTDAPILGIKRFDDRVKKAWAFMDYQIRSVQQDLAEHGKAVFVSAI